MQIPTFRNRDDYKGDRDDENLHKEDTLFTRCPSDRRVSGWLKDRLRKMITSEDC